MAVRAPPLVEREREIESLERLLDAARDAAGGAIVVEGPPGIGKSSLLSAARTAAGDLAIVSARASELEREYPFGVVRQLFEPILMGATAAERETLLAGAAALAEPVVFTPDSEPGAEPGFSVLHGLYWLAANLAAVRPLLVVVDDAQWADLASMRWLAYAARRLEGVPLVLLLATRPVEPGPTRDLIDELLAIPDVEVLQPGDLSEAASGELAARLLQADPDPEFVVACHGATGGNPFLLRELCGELARRGMAPTKENARDAGRLSSRGVSRAVRGRLRVLGPDCAALARAAAVLGDSVDLSQAARLAGLEAPAAALAADMLAEASILEPERPLTFVHPLVRSSIDAELTAAERAAEHERAAAVLAEAGAAEDRVALHLLVAPPRGSRATVETLRRVAAGALGRGAPEAAVTYLERALAEPPPAELAADVAHVLGEAALRAGDLGTAITSLREATRSLEDDDSRARAADTLGSALTFSHRPDEAIAELTQVIDGLPESAREQGLRLQATRWAAARASTEAWSRLRLSGDRFEVQPPPPSTIGERLVLGVAAFDASRERTALEAHELAAGALAGGNLIADPGPESASFWFAPIALLRADALEDAISMCDAVIDWANAHGSPTAFSMGRQLRAFVCWRRGALDEAEADASSALEHAAMPGYPPYGPAALVNVHLARGKIGEAREALAHATFEPHSATAVYYLQASGRLKAAAGETREALDDLFACGRLELELRITTPAFSNWRADAAPLLASLDRTEQAVRLAREEVERCRAYGAVGPHGAALRTLGVLEGTETGLPLLEQAVALLEGSASRLEHAGALLELGAALRRESRKADARAPLTQALDVAVQCGADVMATRIHDELVAAGARPRRDPTESRSNLTAGELRVARMAAEGMTNREIAQSLFLTENTIQTHLKSVFRKLDIGSRSQLARHLT